MPILKKDFYFLQRSKLQHLFLLVRKARERNGVFLTILKGGRLLFLRLKKKLYRFLHFRQYFRRIDELAAMIEEHQGFFDILHAPIGWDTLMFQRYQHLSIEFACLGGFVLYGGNPEIDRDMFVYKLYTKNLIIFDATDAYLTNKILVWLSAKPQPKIIRIQSIDLYTTFSEIAHFLESGFTIIYEYIDAISPLITGIVPELVSSRHLKLLENNRVLVVATADRLIEEVKSHRNGNYLLSTNGVDVNFWRQPQTLIPDDLKEIVSTGNIILGYHGALAQWLDYDLIQKIADTGMYEIVLLGLEHDFSFRQSGLGKHPNVHFLGSKPYSQLNNYANYYDVAILPFQKNELTDAISPLKLFEYMAAQKPIVTTNLHECMKYKSCLVAKDMTEFLDKLQLAVNLKKNPQYIALLDADAQNNSWEQKTIDVLRFANVPFTHMNTGDCSN